MITATLNMKKFINLYNAKEVYNHSVEGPGSVTDPEIFGYGEDRKRKFGYIKLNGHFIDPTLYTMVSRRVYRDLPLIVSGDKKYIIGKNGVLEESADGETGLNFLYKNYGNFRFKAKASELDKYEKEDFFIDALPVMPLHFRDIDTSNGILKIDELNQLYMDLIRATNFKAKLSESKSVDTRFIDMKIQGLLVAIVDYLANLTFFKTGAQRQLAMGRSVDYSSRIVISAPTVRMNDTLGQTQFKLGEIIYPLHHVVNMYPIQILSKTNTLLHHFYELGLMPIDKEEFELHFSDDYITERMQAFYHSYKDRSDFVSGPNGEKFEFDFVFTDEHEKETTVHRGITWAEIFYLAFLEVRDIVRSTSTRFPTTGKGSVLFSKINPVVLNTHIGNLKILHEGSVMYDLEDFCDISPYILHPKPYIYEETQKISNLYLSGLGGDYDGDKLISRSIYSTEAVQDVDNYNASPLSFLSLDGKNVMDIGKEGVQTIYDLTRANENDLVEGSAEINNMINEFFTPNRNFKRRELVNLIKNHSIYTKVKFKGNNTTLGRVIFNEVIFNHIPEHKFQNYDMTKDACNKLLDMYSSDYLAVKKMTVDEYQNILNKYHDLAFSLCEIVASGVTYSMLMKYDKDFDDKRNEIAKKYNKLDDPMVMMAFEKDMIEFSKKHYDNDPMVNLYKSGAGPKWGVDFKNMKVSIGATPVPGSSKVAIIKNNLKDGLTTEEIQASANMQIIGAHSRGVATADAGYEVKRADTATQSVKLIKGDCKCGRYKIITDTAKSDLLGRTILVGTKEVLVTYENIDQYLGKPQKKRTPLMCGQKDGYCSTCTGESILEIANRKEMAVGLFVKDIMSSMMNKSMKSTHDMTMKTFTITDLDAFIVSDDDY